MSFTILEIRMLKVNKSRIVLGLAAIVTSFHTVIDDFI